MKQPFFPTRAELAAALAPELGLFQGRPKLWAVCAALTLIPSLYAVTYLSSVWDPYGQMNHLPVALVNRDAGTTVRGRPVNVGAQVQATLMAQKPVAFELVATPEAARQAVASGKDYFALVIPEDFSRRAIAKDTLGHADLVLISSSGTSFLASAIGKRVATEVAAHVTEQLEAQRWQAVTGQLGLLKQGVGQLKDGAHQLEGGLRRLDDGAGKLSQGLHQAHEGSPRLAAGSAKLADGVGRLTAGVTRLQGGVHTMATKLPADAQLDRLASGVHQLAEGSGTLHQGLGRLEDGSAQLRAGASQLAGGLDQLEVGSKQLAEGSHQLTAGVGRVPIVGGQLAAGAGKLEAGIGQLGVGLAKADDGAHRLADGARQLDDGLKSAHAGSARLASGADQVDGGVVALTGGMKQLGGGIRTMDAKLPSARDLAALRDGASAIAAGSATLDAGVGRLADGARQLSDGAHQAASGSGRLAAGLDTLYGKLPAGAPDAPGTELKAAVTVVEEAIAPATTNGAAFSPYFIALSLWMGAVMTTFVFHFIMLAERVRPVGQRARMLAKGVVPAILVLCQALMVTVILHLVMKLPVPNPLAFAVINATASLTFLAIIMALIMILGDAGKIVAVILLVFQLGAAGGAYPIQLAPPFFQWVHPLLPVTNMVKALRATLFGAYDGVWWQPAGEMALAGFLAWWVAIALGRRRWKYTPDESYSTVLDL